MTETLDIALPKGRLGERVVEMLDVHGLGCTELDGNSRKLVLENPDAALRFFWVKPADVPIYVERGAADLGVAGYPGALQRGGTLRVATKFPNIATRYFQSKGRAIDIIKLNGSIELAPIIGLSDVIVDIVETGGTLRENNLEVLEEILPISARLIANKASYRFKYDRVKQLTSALAGEMEGEI